MKNIIKKQKEEVGIIEFSREKVSYIKALIENERRKTGF